MTIETDKLNSLRRVRHSVAIPEAPPLRRPGSILRREESPGSYLQSKTLVESSSTCPARDINGQPDCRHYNSSQHDCVADDHLISNANHVTFGFFVETDDVNTKSWVRSNHRTGSSNQDGDMQLYIENG